ncbi:MAG: hypothetical protein ABSA82_00355 [Thermacetogeniaceae bacterium]|jgi:hypothetical protein
MNIRQRLDKLESRLIPLSEPTVLVVHLDGEAPPGVADVNKAVAEARCCNQSVAVVMTGQLQAGAR